MNWHSLDLWTSLALGFVLLAAVLFFMIVVKHWPGPLFVEPGTEPHDHICVDYDGVLFKCTRSEFEKWHLQDATTHAPTGDGRLVFERSPLLDPVPPAAFPDPHFARRSKILPDSLRS